MYSDNCDGQNHRLNNNKLIIIKSITSFTKRLEVFILVARSTARPIQDRFITLIVSEFHYVILGRWLWHGVPEKSMGKQRCIAAEYWQNVNSD